MANPSNNIRVAALTPQVSSLLSTFKIDACATVTLMGFAIDGAYGSAGSAVRNDGVLTLENMILTDGGNPNVSSVFLNREGSTLVLKGTNLIE